MKHWIIRVDIGGGPVRDFRAASGPKTAIEAALEAYGIVTENMACKQVSLQTLRGDKRRKAAMEEAHGWVTFRRKPGPHKPHYGHWEEQPVEVDHAEL